MIYTTHHYYPKYEIWTTEKKLVNNPFNRVQKMSYILCILTNKWVPLVACVYQTHPILSSTPTHVEAFLRESWGWGKVQNSIEKKLHLLLRCMRCCNLGHSLSGLWPSRNKVLDETMWSCLQNNHKKSSKQCNRALSIIIKNCPPLGELLKAAPHSLRFFPSELRDPANQHGC